MPTRHQNPDERTFRQDAYASSAEYDRGVLGNIVAARCQKLTDPEEIAMLWWLQQVSWRDGGLELFAQNFLKANQARIGTAAMHRLGLKPGRVYQADEVREIRREMFRVKSEARLNFPLKGERAVPDVELIDFLPDDPSYLRREQEAREQSERYPTQYPAKEFHDHCVEGTEEVPDILKRMLVDPGRPIPRSGLWYLPTFWEALQEWRQQECDSASGKITETEVTRSVFEELDFALEARGFVLLEGREGIGKSEAARAWCEQHPGRAVYVSLEAESGGGEQTMYRSIARRIGTSCSYTRKANQMRVRIQDALQPGHVMLVLDEAHYLWPQSNRCERTAPMRLDWLRTALIDYGVPVALISTPQYFAGACDRFRRNGWNANQIQRRLTRTTVLPETLSAEDTLAVVRRYFPGLPRREAKRVAGVALLSIGYLTTISHLRKRVDFLAGRRAGLGEAELVRIALDEIKAPAGGPVPDAGLAPAPAVPRPRMSLADTLPAPGNRLALSPPPSRF